MKSNNDNNSINNSNNGNNKSSIEARSCRTMTKMKANTILLKRGMWADKQRGWRSYHLSQGLNKNKN